jgi:DNA-binding MarR family transcriptional regulator
MSSELQVSLSNMDRLLHEPSRLLIATILYPIEQADFLYLLRETGFTRGNLSTHLMKLEEAGYIEIEKTYRGKKPQTLLKLTPKGRNAFNEYRKQLKVIMEQITPEDKNE